MKSFKKCKLALLFPLLLAGCAGKGSFDPVVVNDDLNVTPPITPTPPAEELPPQDTDTARYALGWSLDITRRNQAKFKADGTPYGTVKRTRTDGVVIDFPAQAEGSSLIDPKKINANQGMFEPSTGFEHVYVGYEKYSDETKHNVYTGDHVRPHEIYTGAVGTLRYQTDNTAKALPKDQEFTYNGIWAYMTDIDVLREELARPIYEGESVNWTSNGREAGVNYSGSSEWDDVVRKYNSEFGRNKGHFAEFKVNFGEKRLTGKLVRTPRLLRDNPHEAYSIDANINGNRFSGSATVKKSTNTKDENHTYFKSNASKVEGGFYGDTGQELAGSFLADDHSIAVAFGAKRKETLANETPLTYIIDGERINIDSNEDFVRFNLNNLSGFKHLLIDGYNIPLSNGALVQEKTVKTDDGEIKVTYCCSPFEYMKMGEVNHKSERHQDIAKYDNQYDDYYYQYETDNPSEKANRYASDRYFKDNYYLTNGYQTGDKWKYTPFNRSLFIQGERTQEMPTEGSAKYQGSWHANIVHRNIPHTVTPTGLTDGTHAAFEANFANKTLTGKLWRSSDVSSAPSVLIDANIDGVTFAGRAKTGEYGIYVDPDRTLNNKALHFDVPTKGLFFGPKAAELGGSFVFTGISYQENSDDSKRVYDKVGAVYGAKQVNE